MRKQSRRQFLQELAGVSGSIMLFPLVTYGGASEELPEKEALARKGAEPPELEAVSRPEPLPNIPFSKPYGWDPIAFNRARGNAGAIPESYLADINGPNGEKGHLGKHLPYIPNVDMSLVPKGFIPLMWGDPSKGYTPHPNAVPNESNNHEGHWFNWIQVRRATGRWQEPVLSSYSNWPIVDPEDTGRYGIYGGGELTDNEGIHTIYLAALPPNVSKGSILRIWAHCLTHGEYVDFIRL